MYLFLAILFLLVLYTQCKSSRPDGILLADVHPYRYLMPFVMRTRNESVVYFDCAVHAEKILAFVESTNVTITHCLLQGCAQTLHDHPEMNRFVSGRRLYQRKEVVLSFSAKRIKRDSTAKIAVIKHIFPSGSSLHETVKALNSLIATERSDQRTYADKEYALFSRLPVPIFDIASRLFLWADAHNLLPKAFLDQDGMFASAFIANLGSIEMGAGYHHLYEWGNCPLFVMAGAIEERPVVLEGKVVIAPILPLRFSFDERINDGLTAKQAIDQIKEILENPTDKLL